MSTLLLTGASRGIGRALARELGSAERQLLLSASNAALLDEVVREIEQAGGRALALPADLSTLSGARKLGRQAAEHGVTTVVHNAGLWPSRRELTEGVERAFMINHLAPLALQRQLNDAPSLKRVVYVSAGLIAAGRWDQARTPTGEDFSSFRSYCTTKLCGAFAAQDLAQARPDLAVVAFHPGVVRTDLGMRGGLLGALTRAVKRLFFEDPAQCAKRAASVIVNHQPEPGQCAWLDKDEVRPWPPAARDEQARSEVRDLSEKLLANGSARET